MSRTRKSYEIPPNTNIDNQETLKQFGYPATSVSPSGNKKVVCYCSKCNKRMERIRIRVRAPVLCHSCVKSKREFGDPSKLIDNAQTQKQFGYSFQDLPRYSLEKVIGICTRCKGNYVARMKSIKPDQLCRGCIRKTWCEKNLPERKNNGHKLLNDPSTIKQYGYSATALSPQSFKHVIANCTCGKTFSRIRRNIHDKSTCIPCAIKKVDHSELQRKRQKTILKNYPNGYKVDSSAYGQVVDNLIAILEKQLRRKLIREKILSTGKRIDIFDPQTSVGIEYCGLHWHHEHSKTPRDRNYHLEKMLSTKEEGYRLITIFEDEYLSREEAVTNRLLNILNAPANVVYARQCKVHVIPIKQAKQFLNEHHIQGASHSIACAFGLHHKENLIGLITGGRHHRQGHENKLILSRLCFAPSIHVRGGTERLYKRLRQYGQENGYTKIVTWSDNRWTDGNVYSRIGMTLEAELRPDYSYVNMRMPRERLSKQSQKKVKTGCPAHITERDWALKNGLSRIWDCGRKRWSETISG